MKTADESEVKVIEFRCNQKQIEDEDFLEIRGIVNKDFSSLKNMQKVFLIKSDLFLSICLVKLLLHF